MSTDPDRCREEKFGDRLFDELKRKLLRGDYKTVKDFERAALPLAQLAGIQGAYLSALDLYSRGRWEEALIQCRRVLKGLEAMVSWDSAPERTRCLGLMCLAALKLGQFDEATSLGEAAVEFSRQTDCRGLEAAALGHLANVHRAAKRIKEGIECRTRAVALFHSVGDVRGEAIELSGLGNLEFERGHLLEAIEYQQKALRLARQERQYTIVPMIMRNLEHTWATHIGELKRRPEPPAERVGRGKEIRVAEEILERAAAHLEERDWAAGQREAGDALLAFQALKDRGGAVSASFLLAGALVEQGLWKEALEPAQLFVQLCRELDLMGGVEKGLANLSVILEHLDDIPALVDCLEQSLDFAMMHGQRVEAAPILHSLGEAMRRIDENAVAESYLDEALVIFRDLGDRRNEAIVLDALSAVARARGRFTDALTYSEQALEIFEALGEAEDLAVAKSFRGQTLFALGDLATAAEQLADALPQLRRLGPGHNLVSTLQTLAEICVKELLLAEALTFYDEAEDMAQALESPDLILTIEFRRLELQVRNGALPEKKLNQILERPELSPVRRAGVMGLLGWVQQMDGRQEAAVRTLTEALSIAEKSRSSDLCAHLLISRARTHAAVGDLSAAEQDYRSAFILLEGARTHILGDEQRLSYWAKAHTERIFDEVVLLLGRQQGREEDTFEWMQLAKGRSFLDLLGQGLGIPANPELSGIGQIAFADHRLRQILPLLHSAEGEAKAELEREQRRLYESLNVALCGLEEAAPVYAAMRRGKPLDYASIRSLLAEGIV